MKDLLIRQANDKDADIICTLNVDMAFETEKKRLDPDVTLAGVHGLLTNPDRGFYLVAERDDNIVGTLMITKEWSDWRNGFFWWIQSVYVQPDFRRRGIYAALYRFVKKLAEPDPDVCGFRLYVEQNNTKAQSAYSSLGMQETHYKLYEELKGRPHEQ